MTVAPRVSIVVPTHGAAGLLGATLDSVRAQTLRDWELVVVDDGSADGTAEVAASAARADPRIRVVRQARSGIARARNRGLAESDPGSELATFLDHDDVWVPGALERLAAALDAAPALVAAHGLARFIDRDGQPVRPGKLERHARERFGIEQGRLVPWPLDRPTSFANLVYSDCIISVGSLLARRAALRAAGPFDERAAPADDYDLWLRLARLGDFAFVDEVLLDYRLHEGMTSRLPPQRGRGAAYVRRKLALAPENTLAQRRLARAGYRACQRAIVAQRLHEGSQLARQGQWRQAVDRTLRAARTLVAWAWGHPPPWA